jgi:hypothetical protein
MDKSVETLALDLLDIFVAYPAPLIHHNTGK